MVDADLHRDRCRPLRRRPGRRRQQPSIGIDDQSQTVVGWTVQATDLNVWVRGFGIDGTDTGRLSAQQLNSLPDGRQEQMTVVLALAQVAVAYTDDNDGNTYDQIYLGQDLQQRLRSQLTANYKTVARTTRPAEAEPDR